MCRLNIGERSEAESSLTRAQELYLLIGDTESADSIKELLKD
jgi:hypothetical protein